MSSHHNILGIPHNATKTQIKRAYFKKAKILHPDVNNSPNAEADFIRLKMAYEALTNPRYTHPPLFNRKKSGKSKEEIRKEWLRKRNENLRKRATVAARKRKKQAYEETQLFYNSYIFNIGNFIFSVFLILPAGWGFLTSYLNSDDEPEIGGSIYIAIILLTLGFGLLFLTFAFLYKKIFK